MRGERSFRLRRGHGRYLLCLRLVWLYDPHLVCMHNTKLGYGPLEKRIGISSGYTARQTWLWCNAERVPRLRIRAAYAGRGPPALGYLQPYAPWSTYRPNLVSSIRRLSYCVDCRPSIYQRLCIIPSFLIGNVCYVSTERTGYCSLLDNIHPFQHRKLTYMKSRALHCSYLYQASVQRSTKRLTLLPTDN
jgi:hypothetical protein